MLKEALSDWPGFASSKGVVVVAWEPKCCALQFDNARLVKVARVKPEDIEEVVWQLDEALSSLRALLP